MNGPRQLSDDEELNEFGRPVFAEGTHYHRTLGSAEEVYASTERKLKEIRDMVNGDMPERRIRGIVFMVAFEPSDEDHGEPMMTMGGGIAETMIINAAEYFLRLEQQRAQQN